MISTKLKSWPAWTQEKYVGKVRLLIGPYLFWFSLSFCYCFQSTNWKRFGRVSGPKWKDFPVTALCYLSKFIKTDICIVAWTMDHCNFGIYNQQVWVNVFMNILMRMTKESRYCVVLSIMSVLRANKTFSIFNLVFRCDWRIHRHWQLWLHGQDLD